MSSSRAIPRCSLILPVVAGLGPDALTAAIDVLVRTAPDGLDLELALAVGNAAPATRAAAEAIAGDVRVVDGDLVTTAAALDTPHVAVLDAVVRPDLGELPGLLQRLDRDDDPLPFVHRLGLLVTTRQRLTDLPASPPEGPHLIPRLARALRPVPMAPTPRPSLPASAAVAEESAESVTPAPSGTATPRRAANRRGLSATVVICADVPLPVLDGCLSQLRRHLPDGVGLLVVDPGGDYGRSSALRTQRFAAVVPGSGVHPVAAGIRAADSDIVVLLDPATWVTRRWLDGLLAAFTDPSVVAVGPRTSHALGFQRQPGISYRDVAGMQACAEAVRRGAEPAFPEVPALSGVCLAVRRHALVDVGGHDDAFADPELATLDLCLRLRAAGGRLVRADRVFVHIADLARGTERGRWRVGGGELAALRARHGVNADRALPGLVGAVMIVKNEEEKLARALESISGVVDDVVICDTGSTDGTLALLDAFGVRQTSFAWCDDFAAARNAALAEHTGSWGLLLDADETLECRDPAGWRRSLAENPADVVFLVCRNLDSGTGGATVDNASARLLRAEECHWAGRVHEQMVRRDGQPTTPSGNDFARILHDGYTVARIVDRGKVDRNATLTALELADATSIVDVDPGRARFERGRAELLAGNRAAAGDHFRAALELLPERSELLRRMALCNLALLANDDKRYEEALELGRRALGDDHAYTQAAVAVAVALLHLDRPGDRGAARQVLAATIRAGQELADPTIARLVLSLRDEGLLVGDAAMLLGGLTLEAGDVEATIELLEPLAREHTRVFKGWTVLASALRQRGPRPGEPDWADVLAELAEPAPGVLEPLLDGLDEENRGALLAALDRRSIDSWQVSEDDRTWQAMQPELRRMSRAGVVAAARQHEVNAPALAYKLWEFAGDDPQTRVGRARCLDALCRPEAAADLLDGVDPTELDAPDTLFVVALAAGLGDLDLAWALLAGLPDDLPPELAGPAEQMRAVLAAVG